MTINSKVKTWFRAQGRRMWALAVVLFSAKFSVVAWWDVRRGLMQVQHMPRHMMFVVDVTDPRKMNQLIKRLNRLRDDLIHTSQHYRVPQVKRITPRKQKK